MISIEHTQKQADQANRQIYNIHQLLTSIHIQEASAYETETAEHCVYFALV